MSTRIYFLLLGLGSAAFTFLLFPASPQELNWVKVILLFAPTLLIPVWLHSQFALRHLGVVAGAWSLGLAFLMAPGWVAGSLAFLWLLVTIGLAYSYLFQGFKGSVGSPNWSGRAAFLFLPIGAAWALADRLGWQPMGFQKTIVLLTAVHFHYAGFLLLSIADRLIKYASKTWNHALDLLLVLGVPLVAVGITITDLNGPLWIETVAATVMAVGGMAVALSHVALAIRERNKLTSLLWLAGGFCLLLGMALAIAYGWRNYYTLNFLNIPWMYAVHGTLNFLGVGIFLTLGWCRKDRKVDLSISSTPQH